jgi:hypothetical protein
MYKTTFVIVLLLTFATAAFADIARPEKSPKSGKKPAAVDTYLSIGLDRDAKEARLIIPRSQLKTLRAELDAIDNGTDTAAAVGSGGGISGMQTIVSGVFISLAIVFAGIWFARSGRLTPKAAAAGSFIFLFAGLAAIVYGNAGPPAEARSITGKMFAPAMHIYKFGGGKIKLEISDTHDQVQLIVPDPQEPKPAAE